MKKTILVLFLAAATFVLPSGCSTKKGEADKVAVIENILMNRQSVRRYTDQKVSEETLLKVLWAGNGVNRDDGRRTAPSAINAQDVEQYLCTEVTYRYNPESNALEKVADVDIRPIIQAQNSFILKQPVILLFSDQTKFQRGPRGPRPDGPAPEGIPEGTQVSAPEGDFANRAGMQVPSSRAQESGISRFSGLDVGIVSQNISIYCTAAGLGTVPCAPRIPAEEVQAALGLPRTMIPLLYHPIGYPIK